MISEIKVSSKLWIPTIICGCELHICYRRMGIVHSLTIQLFRSQSNHIAKAEAIRRCLASCFLFIFWDSHKYRELSSLYSLNSTTSQIILYLELTSVEIRQKPPCTWPLETACQQSVDSAPVGDASYRFASLLRISAYALGAYHSRNISDRSDNVLEPKN